MRFPREKGTVGTARAACASGPAHSPSSLPPSRVLTHVC